MKADTHPKYTVAQVSCGCGNVFTTRSTKPTIQVEICSACHPFYTGKQKFVDTAGRVEKFQRKYAWTDGKQTNAPAGSPAAVAQGAAAAAAAAKAGGPKAKTLEASSLKQFAARSKHAPAPVALPEKRKPGSPGDGVARGGEEGAKPEAAAKPETAEAKPSATAPAEGAAPKPEKPKGERKPKAEKKPKAEGATPAAEAPKAAEASKPAE